MPVKAAICSKVRAVLDTSQTAVAFGINGRLVCDIRILLLSWNAFLIMKLEGDENSKIIRNEKKTMDWRENGIA